MSYNKFVKKISLPKSGMNLAALNDNSYTSAYSRISNYLPVIYQGPTNRIERYSIYDSMEQDPVIASALDTLAEYITQSNEKDPFKIEYSTQYDLPSSQTVTIEKELDNWIVLNDWKKRIFNIVREVIKFGDVVLIRDPDTNILNKCNIYDVIGVIVDDTKTPTHYIVRNVALNIPLKIANDSQNDVTTKNLINTLSGNFPNTINNSLSQVQDPLSPTEDKNIIPVNAKNVVHLSMNVDNILVYPFGISSLESVYKTYVQKMLVQDCILLYRIKNATEKLVFNIPVGNIPRSKRMQYIERCKNELSQRRMPSKDSDGVFNTIDVAYSSIPFNEDYWLPVDSDGVQPKIEKLAGGQALGEINDLVYWENQLLRGLKVPSSWIPYGPSDGQRTIPSNTTSTYIQEQRFFKYCKRIQNILIGELDKEFKRHLKKVGITLDEKAFELSFYEPSNITEITEIDLENSKISLCSAAMNIPYISKQFALKHYLKLTDEEYNENEKLLTQEMQSVLKGHNAEIPNVDKNAIPGLRSINITQIPMNDIISAQNDLNAGLGIGGGAPMGDMGGAPMGDMGVPEGAPNSAPASPSAEGLPGGINPGAALNNG